MSCLDQINPFLFEIIESDPEENVFDYYRDNPNRKVIYHDSCMNVHDLYYVANIQGLLIMNYVSLSNIISISFVEKLSSYGLINLYDITIS